MEALRPKQLESLSLYFQTSLSSHLASLLSSSLTASLAELDLVFSSMEFPAAALLPLKSEFRTLPLELLMYIAPPSWISSKPNYHIVKP